MRVIRVVDLSVPVDGSTVVYPGDPEPRFEVHSTIEHDGFNLLDVHIGSQSGTHVDAPYHFEADGLRVDELPVDRFVGPAAPLLPIGVGPATPLLPIVAGPSVPLLLPPLGLHG